MEVNILINMRSSLILKLFFLIYVTSVVGIFYKELNKDTIEMKKNKINGLGITAFVLLSISLVFTIYQIYQIYHSI